MCPFWHRRVDPPLPYMGNPRSENRVNPQKLTLDYCWSILGIPVRESKGIQGVLPVALAR